MKRRRFLKATTITGIALGTAGCMNAFSPNIVESPPAGVYKPVDDHTMELIETTDVGPYRAAVTYSITHEYYTVDGGEVEFRQRRNSESLHVMVSVWHPESGVTVPVPAVETTMTITGDVVDSRQLRPMLSQRMGFHHGDNIPIPGTGGYEIDISVAPVEAEVQDGMKGDFAGSHETTIQFDFHKALRDNIQTSHVDAAGERGALGTLDMDFPMGRVPPVGELPGERGGTATSNDAIFAVSGVETASGARLIVSPRTPYNRYLLPFMSLSAAHTRGTDVLFDGELRPAIRPDIGYHYAADTEGVEPGDEVEIQVNEPPQVDRHSGYQTAFIDMDAVTVEF